MEGAGGHTQQIILSKTALFISSSSCPPSASVRWPVPHYSALLFLLNASHAHDSGLLPGVGSVPVKTTHVRMTVQMHDSVMSQQSEAKLPFKQMHMSEHVTRYTPRVALFLFVHGLLV